MRQGLTQGLTQGPNPQPSPTRKNRRSEHLEACRQGLKGAGFKESPPTPEPTLAAQQSEKSAPFSPCESSHVV